MLQTPSPKWLGIPESSLSPELVRLILITTSWPLAERWQDTFPSGNAYFYLNVPRTRFSTCFLAPEFQLSLKSECGAYLSTTL